MLKFIRGKGQQPSAERQRLQKELFSYRKTTQHGFPYKPSALAFDPISRLMAIGSQTGAIKIYGQPGIEFYGHHTLEHNSPAELNVQLLEWVYGTGRLLSLTAANQLVLWEPSGTSTLTAIKSLSFDGKLKKISSLCCSLNKDIVWIGTEGGNIYQFDLATFSVREPVIYHDAVLMQIPDSYKLNPGAIESIRQLPNATQRLLIAYNRGLCVLWDLETSSVARTYIATGHGQSVGLFVSATGAQFTWYHADGSHATWQTASSTPPKDVNHVPYGPDPCKSINRLYSGKRGTADLTIFSGGMPRSAYGDHNCVSVHASDGHKVCLDFTSKVIDFFVTYRERSSDNVEVLIVLLEEELCAYDLTDPKVPPLKAPYLHSVHASAVTCNYLASQVAAHIYEAIVRAGNEQDVEHSKLEWPISGGLLPDDVNSDSGIDEADKEYEVLLTGHEDGSVKFWDCTSIVMKPIYHFKSAQLFGGEHFDDDDVPFECDADAGDDGEPPFRKAGLFDPYSDDPRFAVKKIALCPKTGRLIVGGTAGQVIIAHFTATADEAAEPESSIGPLKVATVNLVSEGFAWKGHEPLCVRSSLLQDDAQPSGSALLEISGLVQVLPPASITCLALESNWSLVSAGTAHGLVLFDYSNFVEVLHRCTLSPNEYAGAGEQLSRRKSFKKSLRESFRKLRKGRSTRKANATMVPTTLESRPVERQVEARAPDDGMGSMVRCLLFARTYLTNVNYTEATLWSATNAGTVSVFLLRFPQPTQAAPARRVTAQFAKEIQLKHRAPVIGISIFDESANPVDRLPQPTAAASGTPSGRGSAPTQHRVLIASEEQFKIYSLPQLKPLNKYKLTAHEGARIRRIHIGAFACRAPAELIQHVNAQQQHHHHGISPTKSSRSHEGSEHIGNLSIGSSGGANTEHYSENALLCLTNLGDLMVLSLPELRRQLNAAAVRREDINGISSLCFTNSGEALYMMSSSELQRISLATAKVVQPNGTLLVEPFDNGEEQDELSNVEEVAETDETEESKPNRTAASENSAKLHEVSVDSNGLSNGIGSTISMSMSSLNRANETTLSSIGDITVDSVRDHLNATTTTLCSQITEETVGRLTVLSTNTNHSLTTANMKDISDFSIANLKELAAKANINDNNTGSVVIKSVITSVSQEKTNGETEIVTTKTTTHEESQF